MEIGRIYRISGLPIYPQKDKFAVCVCVSKNYILLINSENRALYDCVPLKKKGRAFPRHDSYIGCRNLFQIEEDQIEGCVGSLDLEDTQLVLKRVKESKTLVPIDKNSITADLQEYIESFS